MQTTFLVNKKNSIYLYYFTAFWEAFCHWDLMKMCLPLVANAEKISSSAPVYYKILVIRFFDSIKMNSGATALLV